MASQFAVVAAGKQEKKKHMENANCVRQEEAANQEL